MKTGKKLKIALENKSCNPPGCGNIVAAVTLPEEGSKTHSLDLFLIRFFYRFASSCQTTQDFRRYLSVADARHRIRAASAHMNFAKGDAAKNIEQVTNEIENLMKKEEEIVLWFRESGSGLCVQIVYTKKQTNIYTRRATSIVER